MNKQSESYKKFEIFLTKDNIVYEDWSLLVKKISSYTSNFTLEFVLNAHTIEIYLVCDKDLSLLSTKIDGFILAPSHKGTTFTSEINIKGSLKLSTKTSFLEQKEKEEFKNEKKIKNVFITHNKKLNIKFYKIEIIFADSNDVMRYNSYFTRIDPLKIFEFNFKESSNFKKKSAPVTLKFNNAFEILSSRAENPILEVSGFPYFSESQYVNIQSFDYAKHSLVVGQTGVGKSKFLEIFVNSIGKKRDNSDYAVVIIDPHANLFNYTKEPSHGMRKFDFISTYCELFPSFSEPKVATELTILLFKTLLADQFNAKMERTLKYVLYTLFKTNQMSISNIKKLLLDFDFRNDVLNNLGNKIPHINQYFNTEYIEMQTQYYEIAIMPILVLIDELEFLPAFSNYSEQNLEKSIKENFLTVFSLNKIYLGDKATRLIAGLIIQQLFLIAQKQSVNKKLILVIDEVSTVENESLIHILAEARKFNLSLILAQQYLTQISQGLLSGILSNVYNYFIFKIYDGDAKTVSKNLEISFPDDILVREKIKGISEEDLKRNILVGLNPRECIVRLFGNGKFYPSFKAKTITYNHG